MFVGFPQDMDTDSESESNSENVSTISYQSSFHSVKNHTVTLPSMNDIAINDQQSGQARDEPMMVSDTHDNDDVMMNESPSQAIIESMNNIAINDRQSVQVQDEPMEVSDTHDSQDVMMNELPTQANNESNGANIASLEDNLKQLRENLGRKISGSIILSKYIN